MQGKRKRPERKGHFLPNILGVSIQIVGREGAQLFNGLVLPCTSLLAAFLHTLSITYLLWYFTSHVHDAKSVAVVYDDLLMVFMP